MSGRKEDYIWQFFIKITDAKKTGCRAVCKKCKKEIQGIVQRMKIHHQICEEQAEQLLTGNESK